MDPESPVTSYCKVLLCVLLADTGSIGREGLRLVRAISKSVADSGESMRAERVLRLSDEDLLLEVDEDLLILAGRLGLTLPDTSSELASFFTSLWTALDVRTIPPYFVGYCLSVFLTSYGLGHRPAWEGVAELSHICTSWIDAPSEREVENLGIAINHVVDVIRNDEKLTGEGLLRAYQVREMIYQPD